MSVITTTTIAILAGAPPQRLQTNVNGG